MMWCLVPPTDDAPYLLTVKTHQVGRRAGDIILNKDGSVSRDHAKIEVKLDGVYVSDAGSKFGTYIDEGIKEGTRIDKSSKVQLKEGGQVRFGLQNNIWTLQRNVPYVCFDIINDTAKKEIVSLLSRIGGKAHLKWTKHTSHLTTNSLRLSPEVLCALASAKPIVFPSYWRQYELMTKGQAEVPNPENFIPAMNDKKLLSEKTNLCLPNVLRKTLFKDKTFVFPSTSSYEALKNVVEMAGGQTLLLSDCSWTLEDFCRPHVVILSCEENKQTSLYKKVIKKLLERSHRVIPEDDIGLALWKTSIAVHCNPKNTAKSIFHRPQQSNSAEDSKETIVMDTEDIGATATGVEHTSEVIPPSFSENLYSSEDKTLSLSMRPNQSEAAPALSPVRRTRDDDKRKLNTNSPGPSTIKREPDSLEEEDIFASEIDNAMQPARKTSILSLNAHRPKEKRKPSSAEADDFLLPSPPRRKMAKLSGENVEDDAFNLPAQPVSKKVQIRGDCEEEPDFLDTSMPPSRLHKTNKSSILNESTDLFADEIDKNSPVAKIREKRKDLGSEKPPAKRLCGDVRNVNQELSYASNTSGWLYSVKKEEEEEICNAFQTTVVFCSLLRKPKQDKTCASPSISGKNFKKFRKVWSNSSAKKLFITTTPVLYSSGRGCTSGSRVNSTGEEEDQDDDHEDDFPSSRPAARGRGHHSKDEDDEFALPSYSQV